MLSEELAAGPTIGCFFLNHPNNPPELGITKKRHPLRPENTQPSTPIIDGLLLDLPSGYLR
jgi:hypothetical protein